MGSVFLICGLLLATQHPLGGGVFLVIAAIIFYYAPRWDLRIEVSDRTIRFSENVVDTRELEIQLADISEIRRVEEHDKKRPFLSFYSDVRPFIEFVMRTGKIHRLHDNFDEDLDDAILEFGNRFSITVAGFSPDENEELKA